jgi:hypothetical protein
MLNSANKSTKPHRGKRFLGIAERHKANIWVVDKLAAESSCNIGEAAPMMPMPADMFKHRTAAAYAQSFKCTFPAVIRHRKAA